MIQNTTVNITRKSNLQLFVEQSISDSIQLHQKSESIQAVIEECLKHVFR